MYINELKQSFKNLSNEFSDIIEHIKNDDLIVAYDKEGVQYYAPRWLAVVMLILVGMMLLTGLLLMAVTFPVIKTCEFVFARIKKLTQGLTMVVMGMWLLPMLLIGTNNGITWLGKLICRKAK